MNSTVRVLHRRLRPREGWIPLLLLLGVVANLATAVLEAAWVPEDNVVISTVVGGLLLGSLLAKRPLSTLPASIILFLYAVFITLIDLADLWPPLAQLRGGWQAVRPFWLQNGALFWDRSVSWFTAVSSGGSSQETIIFALGLGLMTFFLAAFVSWKLFRQQRPLPGLLALGLGLAFNGYFGGADIWWMALFVGLAALLTAVMHIFTLQAEWDANQVDYSGEVQIDLLVTATVIAVFLLTFALLLPGLNIRQLVATFQEQPAVQQVEAMLERVFAGVDSRDRSQPSGPDGVGGGGILPRNYLLGDAPELYETVVLTAVVHSEVNLNGIHWRALSYDVYTGRGWALSQERKETLAASNPLPLPPLGGTATVSQTVSWLQDGRLVRYSLGLPRQFEQEVEAIWRGQTDLVRVHGDGNRYTVQSQISQASPTMLRQTAVADIDPTILARYTALPATLPQRVRDLAAEVAAAATNPYDQAIALEQFLRQYPYSLQIEGPPPDSDPVDYFLFEQQAGYCDYYASAMVVLARSLGLPARLGIGYLAQPPDEDNIQTMRQINGHSWAEIYFDGYGWVEFEPTAAFASPHNQTEATAAETELEDQPPKFAEYVPPLPEIVEKRPFPWLRLSILGSFAAAFYWLWQQNRLPVGQDSVVWSYGRLQNRAAKLGHPPSPGQTPQEYADALQTGLNDYGRTAWLTNLVHRLQAGVTHLTALYIRRIYAGDEQSGGVKAWESWQKVKRPLWLLRVVKLFSKKG